MSAFAHLVHIVLCFLTGLLWIPIYVLCIISSGNKRKKVDREMMRRNTEALEKLAEIEMYRGYKD